MKAIPKYLVFRRIISIQFLVTSSFDRGAELRLALYNEEQKILCIIGSIVQTEINILLYGPSLSDRGRFSRPPSWAGHQRRQRVLASYTVQSWWPQS